MAEIVNLRKARKARARDTEAGKAAENRAKFGQPRHLREQARALEDIAARRLSGHRRDKADEPEGKP